ncbi:MAG: LuxR C-terminal-related transcriptional regulator [Ignavibacteria bacterium]|nr:LuxR C-terminal-related transcriptional regulator [Ignavibacteria bacterium]
MKERTLDNNIFFKLIESYGPTGFVGIDPNDPLMVEAEAITNKNDQFFYFGDLILFQILYTSKRSLEMLGVEPSELSTLKLYQVLHPDEMERIIRFKNVLMKIAHNLFLAKKGIKLLSTKFLVRNAKGKFINVLSQCYIFYSEVPYKSVFVFEVHTNIDWVKKQKNSHHYYLGEDMSNFRYPDEELLKIADLFSKREFDILHLLEKGFTTEQVAKTLFLSPLTIKTHRRNILHKAGKTNIQELIFDLKEHGYL